MSRKENDGEKSKERPLVLEEEKGDGDGEGKRGGSIAVNSYPRPTGTLTSRRLAHFLAVLFTAGARPRETFH
jgi:hypothetical protein